jgi:hypothetical protein
MVKRQSRNPHPDDLHGIGAHEGSSQGDAWCGIAPCLKAIRFIQDQLKASSCCPGSGVSEQVQDDILAGGAQREDDFDARLIVPQWPEDTRHQQALQMN